MLGWCFNAEMERIRKERPDYGSIVTLSDRG
jgi:hypothetical protein